MAVNWLSVTAVLCMLGLTHQAATAHSVDLEKQRPVYRASKAPDPAAARRVALVLGEGKHIVVRLHSGKTHRGHIQAIDPSQFRVRIDRTGRSLEISFDEVAYLEQNLTRRAKIAIVAAVGAAAFLTIFFLWLEYGD
jgi:hypothetical protein